MESLKSIVNKEARSYTEENHVFFQHLSKEAMQDYVIGFFFRTLNKLLEQDKLKLNLEDLYFGEWYDG